MSIEISDPIYHDENAARRYFETLRWPNGVVTCPLCGVEGESAPLNGNSMGPGWFYCSACKDKFTVRVGTVYERSHIPLTKWAYGFRMMNSCKNGVSAHELHRTLNITYKSAWFMAHRIREAMALTNPSSPLGGKGKVVEADKTWIGGTEANKHANKRRPRGAPGDGKAAVVSLVERQGAVRSFHVADVNGKTLRSVVTKHADHRSHLMTDSARAYPAIGEQFAGHSMVDHSAGEYARGHHHSNTVENYFSQLKRGVDGTYRHVSEAHLSRYLSEFDFRYSNRQGVGVGDVERTALAVKGAEGKRLTYRPAR